MFWENPSLLFGLWVLPFVAGLLIFAHRRRKAAAEKFADMAMVARLMPSFHGARPWVKGGLLLAGLALLIAASARPRFGEYFEVVAQRGVDLFVLLDVSRSMMAEDVAPNRLEHAKSDIRDLLNHLVGDRVGLIVFAGKPSLKVPLTSDQGFFRMVLDEVDTSSTARGGTLIGDAIRKGLESMPERRDRDQCIVLISDGEDQESFPLQAAEQAGERGIKILTVGLGSSGEGARIPIRDEDGQLRYLKHQGQEVWSQVDERLLKQIALATGGAYIPAGTRAYDLGAIYVDQTEKLNRGALQEEKRKRYREQFQPFVCVGILLLLIEMLIPSYRRSQQDTTHDVVRPVVTMSGLLFVMLAIVPSAAAAGSGQAAAKVRQGVVSFRAEKYEQAARAFADADVALPENPWIEFDRACAYQAQGDVEKARKFFQSAALSRDESLAAKSHYNLGGLAAAEGRQLFGDQPQDATADVRSEGTRLLLTAVRHYRNCLDIDPNHEEARHNLEVIRVWLKHMDAVWKEKDREQNREEMDLLQFLQMLDRQQRNLRTSTRGLIQQPESPQRRQATVSIEQAQRQLAEEMDPLVQKIEESLQPDQPSGSANPSASPGQPANSMSPERRQKAIELLTQLARDAGQAMGDAADRLDGQLIPDATVQQTTAVEKMDEIYMAVVPFPGLVGKAVQTQKELLERVAQSVEAADSRRDAAKDATKQDAASELQATASDDDDAPTDSEDEPGSRVDDPTEMDHAETSWDQHFVARWAEVLGPKAEQALQNLPDPNSQNVPPPQPATQPGAPDAQALQEQMAGMRQSMEKAVELGPQVHTLASEAATLLQQQDAPAALPKQEQALKLLQEIAEPLPKQDQQQDQQEQEQEQEQQQQQQQDQSQQQPDQQQQQAAEDLSRRQAEAVLRKARERQRERRDLDKELGRQIYRPGAVRRDW